MVVRFDGYFKPSPIDMCATMDFSQKRRGGGSVTTWHFLCPIYVAIVPELHALPIQDPIILVQDHTSRTLYH